MLDYQNMSLRVRSWPLEECLGDLASIEVVFEALEANRNRSVQPLRMAPNLEEFITRNRVSEAQVREFLKHRQVLTLPAWLQH